MIAWAMESSAWDSGELGARTCASYASESILVEGARPKYPPRLS